MSKDTANINSAYESQGELFPEFQVPGRNKFAHLKKEMALGKKMVLSVSYENLVLFLIVLIMLIVVFFSLGVERGKRAAIRWAITHANKINKQEQADTLLKPSVVPRKIAK